MIFRIGSRGHTARGVVDDGGMVVGTMELVLGKMVGCNSMVAVG